VLISDDFKTHGDYRLMKPKNKIFARRNLFRQLIARPINLIWFIEFSLITKITGLC